MKTSKFAFEINWPLAWKTTEKNYGKSPWIPKIWCQTLDFFLKVAVKANLKEKKSRELNALSFEKLGLEYIHNSDLKHL